MIKKQRKIKILGIDKKEYKGEFSLLGDNIKYLKRMDLSEYTIIDLDTYGTPVKQIEAIIQNGTYRNNVIIFFTFIQTLFGGLPHIMLEKIGYSKKMVKKCPSLFNRNGFEKFKQYISKYGVTEIEYVNYNNKYYGKFLLSK
jgi:tRNA G26 N,N-dimethylase Trm1